MSSPLTPIIQKMLSQVMSQINTPGNPFYFPTWIVANHYDPYGKDKVMQWDLQLTDPKIISLANTICPTIDIQDSPCADGEFIGVPNDNPHLTLGGPTAGGLVVTGASNAVMASMTCNTNDPMKIVAVMLLSTLANPSLPKHVAIDGKFIFTQYCCCSQNGTTCNGPKVPEVGTGTFNATFNKPASITLNFDITDLRPGVLNIAVRSIIFVAGSDQAGNIDISVDVTILSIPKTNKQQAYSNMAKEAFNSQDGLKQLVQQINVVMNDPSQLSFMSQALTNVIHNYLSTHHLYPFDGSHLAIA